MIFVKPPSVTEEKQRIRTAVKETLSLLSGEVQQEKSRLIFRQLLLYPVWKRCSLLFAYASMKGEVDTDLIIRQGITDGKLIALPRIDEGRMKFHVLPPGTKARNYHNFLEKHSYGFYQPKSTLPVIQPSSHLMSLMLVPGLAFDTGGNRLGRGKGYYDAYICDNEQGLHTLGICFSEQLLEAIPAGKEDKKIRALLSDSGIVYRRK